MTELSMATRRALLDTVAVWARQSGFAVLTRTTFAEVPWNAPYYERLGWSVVDPSELTPGLAQRCVEEAARGLNHWPRVVMRFPVS